MKTTKTILINFLLLLTTFALPLSCKKGPGEGGRASIKGKIWVTDCGPLMTGFYNEHTGADDDVYLIFGEETSYGDHVKTDYEGDFEFKYLRKGNYKLYVYTMDTALIDPNNTNSNWIAIPAVKEITISGRKDVIDVGTINIYKSK